MNLGKIRVIFHCLSLKIVFGPPIGLFRKISLLLLISNCSFSLIFSSLFIPLKSICEARNNWSFYSKVTRPTKNFIPDLMKRTAIPLEILNFKMGVSVASLEGMVGILCLEREVQFGAPKGARGAIAELFTSFFSSNA